MDFLFYTVPAYVHSVRALEIAGITLLVVSLGCGILRVVVWKDTKNLAKCASGLSIGAGKVDFQLTLAVSSQSELM